MGLVELHHPLLRANKYSHQGQQNHIYHLFPENSIHIDSL
jgi:hypothetical protein